MLRVIRPRSTDGRRSRPNHTSADRNTQSTTFTRRSLGLSVMPNFFPRRTASGPVESAPASALTSPTPSPIVSPFDSLSLVRRLPIRASAPCFVKAARHVTIFSKFDRYWLQLRGRLVIMLLHDDPWSTRHPPSSAITDHMLPKDAVIVGIFCIERCIVVRPRSKSTLLKITHPNHPIHIWLRFDSDPDCYLWEKALTSAAAQRVVGISDFEFISPIGKGASGKVFLVSDRSTGEKLALKVIDKSKVFETRSAFRHALDERLALELVDGHPFFSRLRYAFQTRSFFYLAIDFYDGGDLYQYLRTHHGRLRESQVRAVSAQVLLALEYFHSLGFIYRDLKPENVLLDSKGHVRLADFGLCKLLPDRRLTSTICGTHTYAAPEILSARSYGKSIDLWAFGVFVYHILRGRTPYEARDLDQVIANMSNRRIRFSSSTSPELVSMVKKLLDWNPDTRLGCATGGMVEVRGHSFFKGLDWRKVYLRDDDLPGLFTKRPSSHFVAENVDQDNHPARIRLWNRERDVNYHAKIPPANNGSPPLLSHRARSGDEAASTVGSTALGVDAPSPTTSTACGGADSDAGPTNALGGLLAVTPTPGVTAIDDVEGATTVISGNTTVVHDANDTSPAKIEFTSGRTPGRVRKSDMSNVDASDVEKICGPNEFRRPKMTNDGSVAASTQNCRKKTTVSLREQMVAAAEEDDLRNFDMREWGKISVDVDHDDATYGDAALWPFTRARRKLLEEERMVVGFGYSSMSRPMGLPENL